MFQWSSNFSMVFGAIVFLPISSALPEICSSFPLQALGLSCNNVTIARMCQKEECCKKQAAACDTIPILQEAADSYFLISRRKLWGICHNRFLAYKKPETNTAKIPSPVPPNNSNICPRLLSPCNSVFAAQLCKKEEWCKKQAAACDTIPILREASYINIVVELRKICHNKFLAYKKLETNTTEVAVPVDFSKICSGLASLCNSVFTARMCQKEGWCKVQAAACDILLIHRQYNYYFNNMMDSSDIALWDRDFRKACHNKFLAYKKLGTDTTEVLVDNSD